MCHGVTKSGSPMPREITPDIDCTISKKSRMPERGMARTWSAIKPDGDGGERGETGRCMIVEPVFAGSPLGAHLQAFFIHHGLAKNALLFVGLEIEMGGGREHA